MKFLSFSLKTFGVVMAIQLIAFRSFSAENCVLNILTLNKGWTLYLYEQPRTIWVRASIQNSKGEEIVLSDKTDDHGWIVVSLPRNRAALNANPDLLVSQSKEFQTAIQLSGATCETMSVDDRDRKISEINTFPVKDFEPTRWIN